MNFQNDFQMVFFYPGSYTYMATKRDKCFPVL